MAETILDLRYVSAEERLMLYGPQDRHLKIWEDVFDARIWEQDERLCTDCTDEDLCRRMTLCLQALLRLIHDKKELEVIDVRKIADHYLQADDAVSEWYQRPIGRSFEHKLIYPKTKGQMRLLESLRTKDMTFVSGPAGTGKTFLAVVYAVGKLRNEEVKRLIITRPVVEAGENLGFLPGDLKEKIDPYLRPIYDALVYMLGQSAMERYMEKGMIEIAPLAYMRGRTLDDAIIILDEAQNTTRMQMKMFLTRMGFHSQMIITGDETQVDLPKIGDSGFQDAMDRLQSIEEIGFVKLTGSDVVRHPLVKKILHQYES